MNDQSNIDQEPSHEIMEQAAEWYGLLRSGEAVENDRNRCQQWISESPEHQQAWLYVEAVSRHFLLLKDSSDPHALANGICNATERAVSRRQALYAITALAGSTALAWLSWQTTPLPLLAQQWNSDFSTQTGEIKDHILSDGSQVWLNTATAVNKLFDPKKRLLKLKAGEIYISTATDKTRPFLVTTQHGQLKALGTKFTVRLFEDKTHLAVYEGAVEIITKSGNRKVINSGEQINFSPKSFDSVVPADKTRELWRKDIFLAQDIPLKDVIAELRRYRNGHLGLSPEVAELKVFGSFPLQDTDKALELLAYALPVQVKHPLPWWVSIEAE